MKCHNCSQLITNKLITTALDAEKYIAEYGTFDDEIVWVAKDGKANCHTHDTAHYTTKQWYAAQ
jgi:hypothetical protein